MSYSEPQDEPMTPNDQTAHLAEDAGLSEERFEEETGLPGGGQTPNPFAGGVAIMPPD